MRRTKVISTALLLLTGCIGGPDERTPPDLPPPPSCGGMPDLELGRCIDESTGAQCAGGEGEVASFETMTSGSDLRYVTGPQGSSMFVIAARAEGIYPGDPENPLGRESPLVEMTLVNEAGATISVLRRRAAFDPDPAASGMYFNGGFFVIVDDRCPRDQMLRAVATLEDRDGETRCGDLEFTADCGG